MENNNKQSFFYKYASVMAIVSYIVLFSLASSIIGVIIYYAYVSNHNLDLNEFLQISTKIGNCSDEEFKTISIEYKEAFSITNGWSNFITYFLCFIVIGFFMHKLLVIDFKNFKINFKKIIIYTILSTILFLVIGYSIDYLFSKIVTSSANQKTIETIINYGGAVPMIISTVILAPVVEELVYRKAIFDLLKKYNVIISYVVSIVFFALPHMLSTNTSNIGIWFLQLIPYLCSGFMLAIIYHKSNYNIYTSIFAHLMNNLLAVILMFI